MIAETLAGIALVKSAVDGIKSAIGTANDIGDIAGHIDNLFKGEQQVQKERNKKSGSRLVDQFGVDTVAKEVINARIAQEKMQEMATMIDMRFGPGTWRGIVDERARRIQEAKEAAAKAKKEEMIRRQEMLDNLKTALILGLAVAAGFAFIIGLLVFSSTPVL
jgi:Fe2+ transport system protein B